MCDKDYSLLRPFDREAAKRGEAICFDLGKVPFDYAFMRDGGLFVKWDESDEMAQIWNKDQLLFRFRMAPLAWVEGKPVYKGDGPLYSKIAPQSGQVVRCDGEWLVIQSGDFEYRTTAASFTWTLPKVKREVKLLAYLVNNELRWYSEDIPVIYHTKRVPSEDKVVEVED